MRSALLLLTIALALAAPAWPPQSEPFVPIGVWLGGAARPPLLSREPARERDAWRRDLQTIRALGFNSVRTWIAWADGEPEPGTYRFDALDQLLALAADARLEVIVQVFTNPAPAWVPGRHPDAAVVKPAESVATPGVCFDDAGVRADAAAFVRAVAARAAASPAFFGIDVGSDRSRGGAAAGDCPATERRFREWLKLKYRTLDAIGLAWSRRFTNWDQVTAPRGESAMAPNLDWEVFTVVKRREDLQMTADAASPRGARPVASYAGLPSILADSSQAPGAADDWWMATAVDQYGTALVPKGGGAAWSPAHLAAALDGIRSATRDRGWWVARLQAGPDAGSGSAVTGADLRLWGWAALSRGASAIDYDGWYSLGGDASGVSSEARIAGTFADVVTRNPRLFAPLRPRPSRVAILYNRAPASAANLVSPADARDAMLGFHRALFNANVQVDFIHPDEILAGLAPTYAAIVISHPALVGEAVARTLRAYVEGGGTLISEARPASAGDPGLARTVVPGFGLDEVFGVRERSVRTLNRVAFAAEPGLDGVLAPLAGKPFTGSAVAERFDLLRADVRILARYSGPGGGDPAVVLSRFGAGRAILVGTLVGAAFERDPDTARANGELIQRLVAAAGVEPEIRIDGGAGFVEARLLESPEALTIIAINHADRPERATLTFARDVPEAIWQNMESGTGVDFVLTASGPTYTRTFAPRDVVVLVIHKSKVRRW